MIEKTENIGLVKEDENEFYNIGTVNGNLDRIDEEFGKKVSKVEGMQLSSEDYTTAEKEKLKNIAENANNYTHPTTAGNKHIPSGGSSGQVLKYGGSSGTASWGSDSYYGTCSTAASTAAKTVALAGFSLFTGATVAVMFSNGNTAANVTLNVNSTGAKSIYYRNSALTSATAGILSKNGVYLFVYSGSYWRLIGDVGSVALSEVADSAGRADKADKLTTPRTIDGVSFDGSTDITHFGVCETEPGTAEKTVSIPGFELKEGARVLVWFKYRNTTRITTLNVNNTGAKIIYRVNGAGSYVSASIENYGIYEFVYNAEYWIPISCSMDDPVNFISSDTTDSNATSWTSVSKLISGTTLISAFNKISTMFKNVRYLYKLLGKTDISAIGDGTVTGILSGMQTKRGTLTSSYAKAAYVYNSMVCSIGITEISANAPVGSNFIIATLPDDVIPKMSFYWDVVTPGGGQIRFCVNASGSVSAYRYNNISVTNIGVTLTYVI